MVAVMDDDLRSIQEARDLLERAQKAAEVLAGSSQEDVDRFVVAMGEAAERAAAALARSAVDDTGMGRYEDKVTKNLFSAVDVRRYILPMKTCGVISDDAERRVRELAVPMGVVAALLPTTNPTSTAIYKALIAVKARNAIVFSPHPRAAICVLDTVAILSAAARSAGAPADVVQSMSAPTVEGTNELMRHRSTAVILATGGGAMVRAAYSSGKPAYGVGPGNAPAIVERTADVAKAVKDIVTGKDFDHGLICAAENALICDLPVETAVRAELEVQQAVFVTGADRNRLEQTMRDPQTGRIAGSVVGRPAVEIACRAGVTVPDGTRVLVVECDSVGPDEFFSREKLSPVLAFYVEDGWEACCERSIELLEYGGIGHTLAIHSNEEHVIERFFVEKPALRVLVNTPAALGAIGATTGLPPALTLGPGTWGGSSTSDNITPMHLLNIKRLAYGGKATALQPYSPTTGGEEQGGESAALPPYSPTAGSEEQGGEVTMTPEEIGSLADRIAKLLVDREWVPKTVRPEPPGKPRPESLPVWAGAAQGLSDVAPVVGRKTQSGPLRPSYDALTAAARGAAAGTAPSPFPGGTGTKDANVGGEGEVTVAVSARHLHVTVEDFHRLFGPDRELTPLRAISQPGQFAAHEQVRIVGPGGDIDEVRIVGPARKHTQVELAASDYRVLGVDAPVRHSGDLAGSAAVKIEGPAGSLDLDEGAIITARHLHLGPECSARLGLADGDRIDLVLGSGERRCTLADVRVRAGAQHATEFHIDTDEAHAFGVTNGTPVRIADRKRQPHGKQKIGQAGRQLFTERDVSRAAANGEILQDCGEYLVTPAAKDRAKALGIWRDG